MEALIALIVFVIVYFFIITEKLNRTLIAVLGAVLLFFLHIYNPERLALEKYVDFKTLMLLVGMMLMVSVIKKVQFFEWVAFQLLKVSNGSVLRVFLLINLFVAFFSAFMDNVTTLLIFIPITFAIVDLVKGDAVLFVVSEIISSNIGGTATLIGDPPNILIGSAAQLSFANFVVNTGIISFLILPATIFLMVVIFRKRLNMRFEKDFFKHKLELNSKLLIKSFLILCTTVVLFVFQEHLMLENWVIAIGMGFVSILVLDPHGLEHHFKEVEWETIFFFFGLFLLTGALEETGILKIFADFLEHNFGSSISLFIPVLFTFSFLLSGFVDNIPFTATMIPVIKHLPEISPVIFANLNPLWWSLSLGVCLGGNLTAIGASANVVAISLMKKHYSKKISFGRYMKYSLPFSALSWGMGIIYLMLRY